MRTCPICSARYEPPAQFCQVDGASLRIDDAPAKDPYLGTRILEQFRLERVLGSGGMGIVYEGWDDGLGRRVAVKILHRDLVSKKDIVARFHREAQIAHQLDHPNIVRVILFGQLPDGNLYLVLEYLEGPTLQEAIDADRVFSPARAVTLMGAISDAIGYAHEKGIIHRDLKPENIIITRKEGEEHPKVLDFGIAKMLVGTTSFVTQSGLIFGTARYISPEGAAGEDVDKRSDVYSLGVITYQLLAGRTPFDSDEPVQLLVKHMHETPTPLRALPEGKRVSPAVADVVMRALAKNPDARWEDAYAFARALREAAGVHGVEVESLVPTSAMPLGLGTDHGAEPALTPPQTLAPVEPADIPVTVNEQSGVSRVRTVSRMAADSRAPRRSSVPSVPAGPLHAQPNGAVVPPPEKPLPARLEFAAVTPPPTVTPEVRVPPTVMTPVVAPTTASADPRRRPLPPIDIDELDAENEALSVPGLSKPNSLGRTLAVIFLSVVVALGAAVGVAYATRMFPSQRREDEIASLVARAQEALANGQYVRSRDNRDVEDLTDAILALEARNPRALAIRRTAAARLKDLADRQRVDGHPDRALPLLQDALRLVDDVTLREELAAAQREADQLRTRPAATATRPAPARPAPAHAPPAHPAPARPAPAAAATAQRPSTPARRPSRPGSGARPRRRPRPTTASPSRRAKTPRRSAPRSAPRSRRTTCCKTRCGRSSRSSARSRSRSPAAAAARAPARA
ncbi:MAG: protein kinase [Polyangiales bacterium]